MTRNPLEAFGGISKKPKPVTQAESVATTNPKPVAIPAWVPFPTDVLPKPLRDYISEVAKALGCDEAYVALPVLAVVAGAVGLSRRISLKDTWHEPAILWTAVVARSGTLKSPALDEALRPLRKIQERSFREYTDALTEFETRQLRYERDTAKWKSGKDVADTPAKPDKPKVTRWLVSDATIEALGAVLADNPRGVLLARDELGAWFGSHDQYKSGGGDAAAWLELHRAGPLTIDRKTGTRITHVPRAAVSITGTIQPQALRRALRQEHFENGMAARFLFAMPPERAKRWTDATVAQSTSERYARIIDGLCGFQLGYDENAMPVTVDIPMSRDALPVWTRFYNEHALRQTKTPDDDLRAALAKSEAYAARFALVFHCVRLADSPDYNAQEIGAEFLEAGVTVARWFCNETERVYAALRAGADGGEHLELVDYIRAQGGSMTARQLSHGPMRFRNNPEARLEAIVSAGFGELEYPPSGITGGRPSKVFRLFPAPGDSTETPCDGIKNGGIGSAPTGDNRR